MSLDSGGSCAWTYTGVKHTWLLGLFPSTHAPFLSLLPGAPYHLQLLGRDLGTSLLSPTSEQPFCVPRGSPGRRALSQQRRQLLPWLSVHRDASSAPAPLPAPPPMLPSLKCARKLEIHSCGVFCLSSSYQFLMQMSQDHSPSRGLWGTNETEH